MKFHYEKWKDIAILLSNIAIAVSFISQTIGIYFDKVIIALILAITFCGFNMIRSD